MPYLSNPFSPAFSSYVGPGDLGLSMTVFYGVRAYSAAYAASGGAAFDLRRSSDSATMTATLLANGDLDTATISSWAGADTIFISKEYDQTGGGRHRVQVGTGAQPTLLLNGGMANKPYVLLATGKSLLTSATFSPATGVISFSAVGLRTGVVSVQFIGTSGRDLLQGNDQGTANRWMLRAVAGSTTRLNAVASDNSWHTAQGTMNGASSVLAIDGSDTTGTVNGVTNAAAITCGGAAGGYCETMMADNVVWSGTDRANLQSNQAAYYA